MKIVITGGHISPALAVIEEIRKKRRNKIYFIGRQTAFEGDSAPSFEKIAVSSLHIPFYAITSARLQRVWTRYTLLSIIKFPKAFFEAVVILRNISPDVILSFGGYVGFIVGLAAYFLRIPLVIHEQTQRAGFANKFLAKFARYICISFPSSRRYFGREKNNIILTGLPLRKEIFSKSKKIVFSNHLPTIYITGGSAGAHFINNLILGLLDKLLKRYNIIHQTGDSSVYKDYERLEAKKRSFDENLQKRYLLKKFFSSKDIGSVYRSADLVVGRAGINTVMEILALGKICFLIPLPYGQKNEQLDNARLVKRLNAGDFVEQKKLVNGLFLEKIEYMLKNKKRFVPDKRVDKLVKKDAALQIVKIVEKCL